MTLTIWIMLIHVLQTNSLLISKHMSLKLQTQVQLTISLFLKNDTYLVILSVLKWMKASIKFH